MRCVGLRFDCVIYVPLNTSHATSVGTVLLLQCGKRTKNQPVPGDVAWMRRWERHLHEWLQEFTFRIVGDAAARTRTACGSDLVPWRKTEGGGAQEPRTRRQRHIGTPPSPPATTTHRGVATSPGFPKMVIVCLFKINVLGNVQVLPVHCKSRYLVRLTNSTPMKCSPSSVNARHYSSHDVPFLLLRTAKVATPTKIASRALRKE